MKKNLLFSIFAMLCMVFATSCQNDEVLMEGNEATVTFEVGAPNIATRAYSDGMTATKLLYAVYDNDGVPVTRANEHVKGTATMSAGKASVQLQLAAGKTYNVLFWAAAEGAPYTIDTDNLTMEVEYAADKTFANDEKLDAFYCYKNIHVEKTGSESVTLTRPFAQLNIGTNDLAIFEADHFEVTKTQVKVSAYNQFNLATGAVMGDAETKTFAFNDVPDGQTFPVSGYEYLAMNYLLVGVDKVMTNVEFSYSDGANTQSKTYNNIPLQRNYRTNIYGQLLTNDIDVNVDINPDYGDDNKYGVNDLGQTYMRVGSADDLKDAFADEDIDLIILDEDITLTESIVLGAVTRADENVALMTIAEDRELIIDLNGKTIKGTMPKSEGAVVKNNGNCTIKNGTISSTAANGGSAIMNNGTLVVENATLNGAPNEGDEWPSYAVNNVGTMTVNNTKITSYHGAVCSYAEGAVITLNDSEIDMRGIPDFTSHGIYTYNGGKVVVNGGTYANKATDQNSTGASVINGYVEVNAGDFTGRIENYYGTPVLKGGTYSVEPNAKFVAEGYIVSKNANGTYSVLEGGVVSDAAQFIAAVAAVKDGGTIKLNADVNFTETDRVPSGGNWYEGIYYQGDKSFTIDLNGKNITNTVGAVNDYMLFFKNTGEKANTITIKNGTVDAGTTSYCAVATASTNNHPITINLENVTLINNNSNGATVKVRGGSILNVYEGTKIVGEDSYTCIEMVGSETVAYIYGGEFYQNGTSSYTGALIGASYGATINIYAGKGVSKKAGIIVMTSGGTINVEGGEWTANTDGTPAYDNNAVLIAQRDNITYPGENKSIVNVTGGTFKGGYNYYGNVAEINISGGNFNSNPADYLEEDLYAIGNNNGTWDVVSTISSQEQFAAALAAGYTKIVLSAGEYTVPNAAQGKTVVIEGTDNPADVTINVRKVGTGGENCDYGLDGSTVTFENVTLKTNSSTYIGYARCKGTYNNCIINGTYTLYLESQFNDCTFNVEGDAYNLWTWGAPTAEFNDCTFNCDGKAVLLYGQANTKLTANRCTFNDNGTIAGKAAIEIGNDYNKSYELVVNNATVNGFDINPNGINTNTTLWANKNSMPKEKLNVVVDGVDVY